MYAQDLPRVTRTVEGLKSETYNAIIDSLRDKSLNQNGYGLADRQTGTANKSNVKQDFYFTCEIPLLERCIFGIILNPLQPSNDPPIVLAENINSLSSASPFQLFTNLEAYDPSVAPYGRCSAIDYYQPTLLFVSDLPNTPLVGMPCGPDYDTDEWGISGQSYGLICISQIDENDNVWCIRTNDPSAIVGIVVDNSIPSYNATTKELGEGLIQIYYRNPDAANALVIATGPDDEPLQLPVFNSSSSTYNIGDLVTCAAVTGIGLLIINSKSLVIGRAVSNILHDTAGNVNIYTGLPGEETWDEITTAVAFNHLSEVVEDEFVFLMPTGASIAEEVETTVEAGDAVEDVGEDTPELEQLLETEIPENLVVQYYIVSNEYLGKILGKTIFDSNATDDDTVEIEIYAGIPGEEVATGQNVTAYVGIQNFTGMIPKNSFVAAIYLASGIDVPGGWYIVAAQRANCFIGKVKVGQGGNNGYVDVDSIVYITLYIGSIFVKVDTSTGIDVPAICRFAPLCDNEIVWVEFNGDCFVVVRAELDGGFYAIAQQGKITNGSTGTVAMKTITNSQVAVSSLKVATMCGDVEQGRTVTVNRNRGGFYIISKSCS